MNLLMVGSTYFKKALMELGVGVITVGLDTECDIRARSHDFDLPEVLSTMLDPPDAVLITDDLGQRVFPSGLDRVDIPKIWYGVDGPINLFWHRHFANLFDLVLADQKDCARVLAESAPAGAQWLPVAVETRRYIGSAEIKKYDLAFIGVVNEKVRPKRFRILKKLAERYSVHVAGGRNRQKWIPPEEAGRRYRQARLVLNENLFDGVTTRMFEAMASGTPLLTETGENGQEDLFRPGRDVVFYGPENLFDVVDAYLADGPLRDRIGAEAQEKALTGHDIWNRALNLMTMISQIRTGQGALPGPVFDRELGKTLFWTALRWPRHEGSARLLRSEKRLWGAAKAGQADAETLLTLGMITKLKGQVREAGGIWAAAGELGSVRAKLGLAYLELERGDVQGGLHRLAATAADFGLDFPTGLGPDRRLSAEQHRVLGELLESRGHDLTPGFSRWNLDPTLWNAVDHYRAALTVNPDHAMTLVGLGKLLSARGAYAEAQEFLERALSLEPHDQELADRAELSARLGYASPGLQRKVA